MSTRTQFRAVCPECFNEQAIKAGRMVDHGYTIPQDWHQRNGSCGGYNAPHFGTVEGRAHTQAYRDRMTAYLAGRVLALKAAPALQTVRGHNTYRITEYVGGKHVSKPMVDLTPADGHWFDAAKASLIRTIARQIEAATDFISFLDGKLAGWTEAAPRAVEVETGPTLHAEFISYSGQLFKGKSFCAPGNSFGRTVYRTFAKAGEQVTCARCIKMMAAKEAALAKKA